MKKDHYYVSIMKKYLSLKYSSHHYHHYYELIIINQTLQQISYYVSHWIVGGILN